MKKESAGKYTCSSSTFWQWCIFAPICSVSITLRILKPIEQLEFEKDDVQLLFKTTTKDNEYKWTFLKGDDQETDIKHGEKYKVEKYPHHCELAIEDYKKENNGTYICRDKETDEQLTAYRLDTKYNLKVDLVFLNKPVDDGFIRNLIDDTERLLQVLPYHVVEIRTPEQRREDTSHRSYKMKAVAYFTKQRNAAEFKEMISRTDDPATVYILFIADGRFLPDLHLDRKHIAIKFKEYRNNVKCDFFDDCQEAAWRKFLSERTVSDHDSGLSTEV